ncbi:enoyl-CoA hydratase-related protein [Tissierella praeacuta]|uniref:enoyl-CoA hydratase/isomerase family protein n=1 Tax=Tissierella praeacuta TaxID=43131 RepID=UPI003512D256
MNFEKINYNLDSGIVNIELNTPENLNALEGTMLDELSKVFDIAAYDDSVKVVVISGNGKAFSAGGDINSMKEMANGTSSVNFGDAMERLKTCALKLRSVEKPVIASIHGAAAGAGFNLALLCDFRIVSDNTNFIQAFINIGLIPDMGGVYSLSRILGVAKATELVMLGRAVNADEALNLGIATKVVKYEDLKDETKKFANKLSTLPSVALKHMKKLINHASFNEFERALARESEYQLICASTNDFKEGINAFIEKRRPEFSGK